MQSQVSLVEGGRGRCEDATVLAMEVCHEPNNARNAALEAGKGKGRDQTLPRASRESKVPPIS